MLLANVRPPPLALNEGNIPDQEPFVLVMNHYDRPGVGAWWGPMVLMRSVAARRRRELRELNFVVAREWWYPRGPGRAVKQPLTRWFFGRLAKTYGLVLVPPVVESDALRGQGVVAVRRAIRLTGSANPKLVCIAPEGRTGPHQTLCEPPRGAGIFLMLLTHGALPCLPAGISEREEHTLAVNFGPPFHLHVDRTRSRAEQDAAAARQVMVEIGKTLADGMWGVYREDIAKAQAALVARPDF